MRIRSALLIAASVVAVAVPMTGKAAACNGRISTYVTPATTVYVDDRSATAPFVDGTGTWTYVETNGIAGLQTGGPEVVFDTAGDPDDATAIGDNDPCYNHLRTTKSDALIL